MPDALLPLSGRYWRVPGIPWQHRPFESGSHLTRGRWNPVDTPALYLSADYHTAIQEMYLDLVRPGTLVAFDVKANAIADLTAADPAVTQCDWRQIFAVAGGVPPTWPIVRALIEAGAEGALVPSAQHRGGVNLVLWRWHDAREEGEGASLSLLDPEQALTGRPRR